MKLEMTPESRSIDAEKLVEQFMTDNGLTLADIGAWTINSAGVVKVYTVNQIHYVGTVAAIEDDDCHIGELRLVGRADD